MSSIVPEKQSCANFGLIRLTGKLDIEDIGDEKTFIPIMMGNPDVGVDLGRICCFSPVDLSFLEIPESASVEQALTIWEEKSATINPIVSTPVVCLVFVPSYMIPQELVHFFLSDLENIKIIQIFRHGLYPSKFLCVVEFISVSLSSEFVSSRHGKRFTKIDPHDAIFAPVQSYDFGYSSTNTQSDDSCPLCLESLANRGLFVTNCNHAFHLDCILKSSDIHCPVCRFVHESLDKGDGVMSTCVVCDASDIDRLWTCLICGFIGCGDPASFSSSSPSDRHAYDHYLSSLHVYCMNLETKAVYDFAGQGFVHRLVLTKISSDNDSFQLGEVIDPRSVVSSSSERPIEAEISDDTEEMMIHTKLESLSLRYSSLLSFQLSQQREFYLNKISELNHSLEQWRSQSIDKDNTITSQLLYEEKVRSRLKDGHVKIDKLRADMRFMTAINHSMKQDAKEFNNNLIQAQTNLRNMHQESSDRLQALELKVSELMGELDDRK